MGARTSALLAQHLSSREKVPSSRWDSGRKPVQERSTPPTGGGDMRSNGAQLLRFTRDGGDVSGISTNAAAELLGVSPNTLRSWERRFGYPKPRRTQGGHRQYDLAELESLRRALLETHNISSAIELARQRGEGPSSPSRLVDAWDHFDETLADRVMEESLAVRSVERSVEEVLLPALELASERDGRDAERELAYDLPPERVVRAIRAIDPTAFVFCGGEATLEVVGRLVYTVRQVGSAAPVFEYREAMPVTGDHGIPSLGDAPIEAVDPPKGYVDSGRLEQVVVVSDADEEPTTTRIPMPRSNRQAG